MRVYQAIRTPGYRVQRRQEPGEEPSYRIYDRRGSLVGSLLAGQPQGSAHDILFEVLERIWEGDHARL